MSMENDLLSWYCVLRNDFSSIIAPLCIRVQFCIKVCVSPGRARFGSCEHGRECKVAIALIYSLTWINCSLVDISTKQQERFSYIKPIWPNVQTTVYLKKLPPHTMTALRFTHHCYMVACHVLMTLYIVFLFRTRFKIPFFKGCRTVVNSARSK